MAGNVFIPFNHRPDATKIQATTYTVPAGYYARVRVTMSCTASASASFSMSNGAGAFEHIPGSDSCSLDLWLLAGDVISLSKTPASGVSSYTVSSVGYSLAAASQSSSVTATVTPVVGPAGTVAVVRATSSASASLGPEGGSPTRTYANWAGTADGSIYAEEYIAT